jgi:hypothetical protein
MRVFFPSLEIPTNDHFEDQQLMAASRGGHSDEPFVRPQTREQLMGSGRPAISTTR